MTGSFLEFHNLTFFFKFSAEYPSGQDSAQLFLTIMVIMVELFLSLGFITLNRVDYQSIAVILFFQGINNKMFLRTRVFHYDSCK